MKILISGKIIRDKIVEKKKKTNESECCAIHETTADETTDISGVEQFSIEVIFARQALASKCVFVNAHDFPSAHNFNFCLHCSVIVPHSFLKQGVPGSMLLSGMFFFPGR